MIWPDFLKLYLFMGGVAKALVHKSGCETLKG